MLTNTSEKALAPARTKGGLFAWCVWATVALFYFYEFFVRVAPAVMEEELQKAFQVNATELSASMAIYYHIYAPLQLIVGILFDRYGGRFLLIPASLVVAMGCFLSIIPADHIWMLTLGRFLIGLGSAFGFIGVIFIASVWFPMRRLALISGMTTGLGMVGAMVGEAPLSEAVDWFGWQNCLMGAGFAGLALAVLLWLVVPPSPPWELERRKTNLKQSKEQGFASGLWEILKHPQTWIIGTIGAALYLPLTIFGDLWGVQYIVSISEVKKATAAGAVSMLYIGWLFGGPISGYISDRWGKRRLPLLISCTLSTAVISTMLLLPAIPLKLVYILLLVLGLCSCSQVIVFIANMEIHPKHLRGTAAAAVNMVVMGVGGFLQMLFGFLLDRGEGRSTTEIITHYSSTSFRIAMLVIPAMMLIGLICCFFMEENCKDD